MTHSGFLFSKVPNLQTFVWQTSHTKVCKYCIVWGQVFHSFSLKLRILTKLYMLFLFMTSVSLSDALEDVIVRKQWHRLWCHQSVPLLTEPVCAGSLSNSNCRSCGRSTSQTGSKNNTHAWFLCRGKTAGAFKNQLCGFSLIFQMYFC